MADGYIRIKKAPSVMGITDGARDFGKMGKTEASAENTQ